MIKKNIKIQNENYQLLLEDNDAVDLLLSKLPMTLNMKELNGNEKYAYLNYKFPMSSAYVKRIEMGDVMLFNDNCLVLFYKSFETEYPYTRIGKIVNPDGLEQLDKDQSITVDIF